MKNNLSTLVYELVENVDCVVNDVTLDPNSQLCE